MRILFDQHSVVEGPGLTLVPIDAKINRPRDILGKKRPLQAGGETRPTTPSKPGILDHVNDFRVGHLQRFGQRFVATVRTVARKGLTVWLSDTPKQNRFEFGLTHCIPRRRLTVYAVRSWELFLKGLIGQSLHIL